MAAPVDADLKYYEGANGTPLDDTGDIGGAIDTGAELDEDADDLLIGPAAAEAFGGSNVVHRGIAYRKLEEGAGGKFLSPLVAYIEDGCLLNAASGTISYVLTANDNGKKMRTVGISAAAAVNPLTTLATGTTSTAESYDTNECWRHELLASDGVTPTVSVDEIVIKRGSTVLGRIPPGRYMATAEYELALASSVNATLSAADRLTNPSGTSAYSRAIKVDSESVDASLTVPGGDFEDGDYVGYVLRRTLRPGLAPPLLGYVAPKVTFEGDASA